MGSKTKTLARCLHALRRTLPDLKSTLLSTKCPTSPPPARWGLNPLIAPCSLHQMIGHMSPIVGPQKMVYRLRKESPSAPPQSASASGPPQDTLTSAGTGQVLGVGWVIVYFIGASNIKRAALFFLAPSHRCMHLSCLLSCDALGRCPPLFFESLNDCKQVAKPPSDQVRTWQVWEKGA